MCQNKSADLHVHGYKAKCLHFGSRFTCIMHMKYSSRLVALKLGIQDFNPRECFKPIRYQNAST